jgi:uncharacterized caspase-like protein
MSKYHSISISTLFGLILLACSIGVAKADRRVALVIGNSHYSNPSLFLANPKNDAEDVAAALRGVGFEVLQASDATKREIDMNMAKFARLATNADAALFYYAGHAVQYQGRNYLMPTDAEVEDEISFRYQMTPLDDVRAALDLGDGVKIIVLDACRNNPVVNALRRKAIGESRSVSVRGGLAKVDKAQGMVVAYSTAADEVAADGDGRNSPFTSAFLKRLKEPGLEIEQLFRRVAADVNTETRGRQRPETYVSLLTNYYLNQTDRIAFEKIRDTSDTAVLQDFIKTFPSSTYISDAQSRLQKIEIAARERQLQLARQQQEAARLEEQRKAEQDAAARKQDEQRARLAAERERKERDKERETVQRLADEQQQRAKTEVARTEAAKAEAAKAEAARAQAARVEEERAAAQKLASVERALSTTIRPPETAADTPAAVTADTCDQDRAKLARLRSNPSLQDVVQFERDLTCEKLRPQIVRLRESLSPAGAGQTVSAQTPPLPTAPVPAKSAVVEKPAVPASPPVVAQQPERPVAANPPPAPAADSEQICKQQESRLARLRANPSRAELIALERELGCEKLRPQIARLRESLTRTD